MERKVGEQFEFYGQMMEVVESEFCDGCGFYVNETWTCGIADLRRAGLDHEADQINEVVGLCGRGRSDGKKVKFVNVEGK